MFFVYIQFVLGTESGRSYTELKADLEKLQAIIIDETGKHSEREKEEANINYEKVFALFYFYILIYRFLFRHSLSCRKPNNLKPKWHNKLKKNAGQTSH